MTRKAWAWARVLGGFGILAALLWRLGTGTFLDALRTIDGQTLAAAAGIGLLTTVFSAWRWCLVARGLGIRLPLGSAIADYYRALFLNAALPGGVLGDVHRAVRHGSDVGNVRQGVRAVVLERSAGQVVLVAVGVTVLVAVPSPVLAHSHLGAATAAAVTAGGLAVALAIVVRRRGRSSGLGRRVGRAASHVRRGLLARGTWPGIVVSSGAVLAGHLATFLVAARAAGSTAPFTQLAPLMLLALLAMTVPVNIGGWGPREGVTAWAFGAAGLSASLGLTIAMVYGLLAFVASLPGAAVLVHRWIGRVAPERSAAGPVAPERSEAGQVTQEWSEAGRPAASGALAPEAA